MQKIITLFHRNYDGDKRVRDEVTPGAEWVVAGEGIATRKYDGTCVMLRDGRYFKRYEVKAGKQQPQDFEAASEIDPNTGKQQGWVPVGDGPEDKWHREAFENMRPIIESDPPITNNGVFELCGPKIQGNPEGFSSHILVSLLTQDLCESLPVQPPRDFEGIKRFLAEHQTPEGRCIEGIVWHHQDGRMVKIKKKDFSY